MVAHIIHDITNRHLFIRFDIKWKMITYIKLAVDVRQILIDLLGIIMVAEETPHTSIGIADLFKIYRTVGFTETEVFIFSIEMTFLTSKGD